MAGRGFAPKPKEQRRNRVEPSRGEWTDLGPLEAPVLPELKGLHERAQALYDAWRLDPVTSTYGPSEVAGAVELAYLTDEFAAGPDPGVKFQRVAPAELRQRMDGLGLTPKGKRDLRVRLVSAVEETPDAAPVVELRSVRAV